MKNSISDLFRKECGKIVHYSTTLKIEHFLEAIPKEVSENNIKILLSIVLTMVLTEITDPSNTTVNISTDPYVMKQMASCEIEFMVDNDKFDGSLDHVMDRYGFYSNIIDCLLQLVNYEIYETVMNRENSNILLNRFETTGRIMVENYHYNERTNNLWFSFI